MAKYRIIQTDFWKSPKISEEMTPEDRYFFLYLLTNSHTTQIGIYKITIREIAFDMGYSLEMIHALMDRMINHHQLIRYNPHTREIAIKNWGKYNLNKGGKPVMDCIISELKEVEDTSLVTYVANNINKDEIIEIYMSYCKKELQKRSETMEVDGEEMVHSQASDSSADESIEDTLSKQKENKQQHHAIHTTIESSTEVDPSLHTEQVSEAVKEITQFWDQNGFGISNMNGKEQLLCWLDDSTFLNPKEIILKAMQIACSTNKRSLGYVVGILKNWENQDLLTVEEIDFYTKNKKGKLSENVTTGRYIPAEFILDLTAGEDW